MERFSAFDAATKTGVAYGLVGQAPRLETWDLAKSTRGATGLLLMQKLSAHLETFNPQMVFVEEPLAPFILSKIGATIDTAIKLPGIVFLIETVCASLDIPTMLYDRQKVLMHFVGRSKWPKNEKGRASSAGKVACQERCRQLRWSAEDYEQADAAALWDFGIASQRSVAWMSAATKRPMLARRAVA